ncbi:MAG: phenylacetate-coenzyme A ligase PaaK-like adenylate-forming protein [Planctomycetota bacterium]|jgi:phenylacetate-coenzyme A ligase PaaK-like adenylate-forming protein
MTVTAPTPAEAALALDAHVREILRWHLSPETGTPVWIDWAAAQSGNPIEEIGGFDDLLQAFDNFDGERLRNEAHSRWTPKAFEGRPYNIFETGGTTGVPKQRIGWDDYKHDYESFSGSLTDEGFPPGGAWLMIGPTGPRRLRLAIEHLANFRGSSCYFVDLDPRWVKKLIRSGQQDQAAAYMEHVIDQALAVLNNREVSALFTTPRLLETLGEKISIPDAGIKGVFCGGTEMSPQTVRFLIEEVLEERVQFVPTYGNTLMGLAGHKPLTKADGYAITYFAPQPRAVLRVTNPDDSRQLVEYGEWGRVELTTLTKEFFLPRFLERDEATRCLPTEECPWDGVGQVRPFSDSEETIVEGVY